MQTQIIIRRRRRGRRKIISIVSGKGDNKTGTEAVVNHTSCQDRNVTGT
jgi:hypothetical protein